MSVPLNLARHPLRNDRLPTALLALACVLLGALTVRHALVAFDLRPGGARDFQREAESLERELVRLRTETATLRGAALPDDKLKEWLTVKALVDRRRFSWTGLFAALEAALPAGVRLVSVAPTSDEGPTFLRLSAVGQTAADPIALVKSLSASPQFEGPFLDSTSPGPDGVAISCSVRYVGGPPAGGGRR
ncbi:MAG TPA: hypothetical protein VMX54_06695 [Vicinamibacteria bacterium]|nr:hypothetical protein [Vicinamibacteria bacterium]